MYSKPRLLAKYLLHCLYASSAKGHGVHSPFVYAFIRDVLNDRSRPELFSKIEAVRQQWRKDNTSVSFTDLGGKATGQTRTETVSLIAKRSLSTPKFGRLLYRISRHYSCRRLLELGSSFGLSGSYLIAGAGPAAQLITVEGATAVAAIARRTFDRLNLNNTEVIAGNFDQVLPDLLQKNFSPDLVFIDGNHREKPLLEYFNAILKGQPGLRVIILHDIHWSAEMESGWQSICSLPEVMLSVDLFFAGIVFFDDKFRIKQHFRIRF